MNIPAGARNNFGDVLSNGQTHKGLDILPPANGNDGVFAPERGEIVGIFTNDLTKPFVGYGPGGIIIRGDDGFFHLLAHLDPVQIIEGGTKVGQRVDEGELIGLISRGGPNGNGTPTKFWLAPHLHWEVREKFLGPAINPISWLGGKKEGFGIEWWVWVLIGLALSRQR